MFKSHLFTWVLTGAFLMMPVALASCQKQSAGPKVQSYAQDGLLGISDVNPNMPMSPTYHTYGEDTNLMQATIDQVPHVIDSNIRINGPVATVNIHVPAELTAEETAAVARDAQDKLTKAMPRYTMKVTVSRK